MCDGFGGFYHKSGKVFFTAPDANGNCSHSDTAGRLPTGINEKDFIPFEISDWKVKNFRWGTQNVPDWADKKACLAKLKEVKPVWAEYEKVTDAARAEMIDKLKLIDGYCQEK